MDENVVEGLEADFHRVGGAGFFHPAIKYQRDHHQLLVRQRDRLQINGALPQMVVLAENHVIAFRGFVRHNIMQGLDFMRREKTHGGTIARIIADFCFYKLFSTAFHVLTLSLG